MSQFGPVVVMGALTLFAAGCGASGDPPPGGQPFAPDSTGWVDKSVTGATGIQGQWHVFRDGVFPVTGITAAYCERAPGECSLVSEPAPDSPYAPTEGRGMCTSGVIARWIAGSDGLTPDGSPGWAGIALDLNMPDWPSPRTSMNAPASLAYDAEAHHVGGFAFDITPEPSPDAKMRVVLTTVGRERNPAFWGGATAKSSPVQGVGNEFEWNDVGGPPPPATAASFDRTQLLRIGFLISGSDSQSVSYSFCINNLRSAPPRDTRDDQLLEPDSSGWVDKSKTGTTGIQGAWYAYGDNQDGECEKAGYAKTECSIVSEPDPGAPTYSPTPGLGMCTSGLVARVKTLPNGQLDSPVYGAGIGFALSLPDSQADPEQDYDAPFHGVTGFSFHIEPEPPSGAELRVHVNTKGSGGEAVQTLWAGGIDGSSPVHAGYNEFSLLKDLRDPMYGPVSSAVYLTRLDSINFHVPANPTRSVSYSFCISNLTALRH